MKARKAGRDRKKGNWDSMGVTRNGPGKENQGGDARENGPYQGRHLWAKGIELMDEVTVREEGELGREAGPAGPQHVNFLGASQ
jgi:hypothetical protein